MKTLTVVLGLVLSVSVMAGVQAKKEFNFACTTDSHGTTICW